MPNKIIIAATNSELTKVREVMITEGTINALKCKIEFRTSDWDDTIKTAVFVRGRATPSTPKEMMKLMLLDEDNECNVPSEILNDSNIFSVGVFGISDNYRMTSNWMYYQITDGSFVDIGIPFEPTPSIYEQVLLALKHKSDEGHTHNDIYISQEEVNIIIDEKINEILTPDAFDAGSIAERS